MALAPASSSSAILSSRCRPTSPWSDSAPASGSPGSCCPGAFLSGAMALVSCDYSFYLVRVLLGIAEAAFFPGIIFYLTLWFPGAYRARIVGWFMAAIPLSSVLGFPFSGLILNMHGLGGLAGWQWLFIIEALPALILAGAVWFYLTDRPEDAHWLEPEERTWLSRRLAQEARQKEDVH